VNLDEASKAALVAPFKDFQERVGDFEEELKEKADRIDHLEARLRQYEYPHTLPSKQQDTATADDDDDARTDVGTVGRNPGHDPAWRPLPDPDVVVVVTAKSCPDCGDSLGEAVDVTRRFVEEIPEPEAIETTRYDRHHYE